MAELLVELFSEEIPARMQARAAEDLKRLLTESLKQATLAFDSVEAFATPRRLALVARGLPQQQPDLTEEKKGPKYGAPAKAIQGFMKANAIKSLDKEAELRETDKGPFYFVVRHVKGRASAEVLPEILRETFTALPWPKSMRWAGDSLRWVRPLHGIAAVFDGKPLKGALTMGESREIAFGNTTRGHRFLAPEPFEVRDFADYREKLREAKVILDPAERRATIAEQAAALAKGAGLVVKDDPGLLDEVTGLVEWPQVLMGRIDAGFMDLPPEVLTTTMRSNQKYFATETPDGGFADRFLVVANMETPEGGARAKTIVAGNERVLRARLADARFFWDQDRQQPLSARVPTLKDIVFHAKLGTVADKVVRVERLAVAVSEYLPEADRGETRAAAHLAKADLTTGMVGEFPELQGVMGRYYALNDGAPPAVADAIAEHYAPLGPNDSCPSAPVSVCVALADKIDTLVSFWAIDEKPTGSKDPYALRRAALGVIRLIVENQIRFKFAELATYPYLLAKLHANVAEQERVKVSEEFDVYKEKGKASAAFAQLAYEATQLGEKLSGQRKLDSSETTTISSLVDFIVDRLKVTLRDRGVRHDLITAVMARGGEDDLVRLLARVEALRSFLETDDGSNLLVAYRRAANIVRIEAKKDNRAYEGAVRAEVLAQDEEKSLFSHLSEAAEGARGALGSEDFTGAMATMAQLRRPVDAFFDEVTVNAEDRTLRENRLQLLSAIGATLSEVADFSKIEG